jgi:hypothetical protein
MNNARIQEAHDLYFRLSLHEARQLHAHRTPEAGCTRCQAHSRLRRATGRAQRRYMKRLGIAV